MLFWLVPYVALLVWIASWRREPLPEESIGDAIGGVVALALAELYAAAVVTTAWIALSAIAMLVRRFRRNLRAAVAHGRATGAISP